MIPVTKAYLPNKEKFQAYVDQIFDSGWLTNKSTLLNQLEIRLAKHLGVKNIICVANGSLALQVAYKALSLKGEVITTPFSFPATVSTQVWEGLTPVFADIDPISFNLAPENIEPLITSRTSAIVPVHVYGNPCEVDSIQAIADKYQLKVIYDAAHAFGTLIKGVEGSHQSVLKYGDISTISFHATKLFHTVEGGAIVTNDDSLANKVRLLINFGITGKSTIQSLGINAKMNEFEAAMGLCVLDEIENISDMRSKVWQKYQHGLNDVVEMQAWHPGSSNNCAYAPVLLKSEQQLLELVDKLNHIGVSPRRYFYPSLDTLDFLPNASIGSKDGWHNDQKALCTVSNDIARRILCLPIYPDIDDQIVDLIIATIRKNTQLGKEE
ncbi:DegT/DnrJ/EryC1/StrS family aminotransferase [Marinomonas sp. GJ51-6]|uniref:DegT/DnrJ/EryC1/StrS family aminotransferase n=1 Tax=Marinomonas sp. GJ51-6 TaxID=2992802 RepID=UPI00293435AF|nr:DegT/DnrJ/EryC1/StrS family aminotransferase [Marinomonas sp. GJ51-6]WOD06182.1 DegT/DnrJ/EryC1/StrS family aminotransferase [Marinomonas sp. GJ51-6]